MNCHKGEDMREPDKKQIRPCLVRGLFYPDTKEEVTSLLDKEFQSLPAGDSSLILAPHGSWNTTRECLTGAYAACRNREVKTVLLLGPVHREKSHPLLYLPEKDYFETPLGVARVDRILKKELLEKSPLFIQDDTPHMEEHCLEVQLPYIRYLFPEAQILPILTGGLNRKLIRRAAEILTKSLQKHQDSLLSVLSVNLSDYLPLEKSREMADSLLSMMSFPLEHSLPEEEKKGRISSCGTVVLTLGSDLFPSAGKPRLLCRQHSSVSDRGMEKGVCYGALSW